MKNKQNYPENWNDEIRPQILKRDGYKCCHCNVRHRTYLFFDQTGKRIIVNREEHEELKRSGYKTYRVYLQVAHLDHNTFNNSPDNLRTLCPSCHHTYDKPFKSLKRISRGRETNPLP